MEASKKIERKVLKELLINDSYIHYLSGSLILLLVLPLFQIPQSLELVLIIFLAVVSCVCLPWIFYRINNSLYLVKNGTEIVVKHASFEHGLFGTKLRFEYEYAGMKYIKTKFFQTIWFPDNKPSHMKLLIDPNEPSNYTILELNKRSVFTIIKNRNL
jgi:hypothetical protein